MLGVCFPIPTSLSRFEINHLMARDVEACQEPQRGLDLAKLIKIGRRTKRFKKSPTTSAVVHNKAISASKV